jgi:hypothetical protein
MSLTAFSAASESASIFALIAAPSALKMSRIPSLSQLPSCVPHVLTGNNPDESQDLGFDEGFDNDNSSSSFRIRDIVV